jgi:glycosyltransferase involved in cell wall biosynthesis
MPRLAIHIACWNYGHFLREALDSARAQTEPDLEIVVVNDGSTDDTAAIAADAAAQDPRVRVLTNPAPGGLARARNQAMRASTAPWCLKLDADDRFEPTYVERILRVVTRRPEATCIFSPARVFGESAPTTYVYPVWDAARVAEQLLIPGPAAFPRALWAAIGGFDEAVRRSEDWDFWVRATRGPGLVPVQLDVPLWWYREHAGTLTTGPRKSVQNRAVADRIVRRLQRHTAATVQAGTLPWDVDDAMEAAA